MSTDRKPLTSNSNKCTHGSGRLRSLPLIRLRKWHFFKPTGTKLGTFALSRVLRTDLVSLEFRAFGGRYVRIVLPVGSNFHFHQTLLCMGGYSKWFSGVKCVHGFWHHSMANHWLTWGLFLFSCRVSRNTACFLTSWPKATLDRVESEITCLTNQKSLAQAHFCCLCLI